MTDALATGVPAAAHPAAAGDGSSAGPWRMPNRAELLSLSDREPTFPQAAYLGGRHGSAATLTGPVIFQSFVVSEFYWTSSTDAADTSQARSIYRCDFGAYNLPKTEVHTALAVR